MESGTVVEMRFTLSVGESLGNNGTFWDSLWTIFNLPALTGDCSWWWWSGQEERMRMGPYITGLEPVTIDFHLFPSAIPSRSLPSRFAWNVWRLSRLAGMQRRQTSSLALQVGIHKWYSSTQNKNRIDITCCIFIFEWLRNGTQSMRDITAFNNGTQEWRQNVTLLNRSDVTQLRASNSLYFSQYSNTGINPYPANVENKVSS